MIKPISIGLLCLIFVSGLVTSIFLPKNVSAVGAASVFVGPSGGTFTVGSTFTVSIYLNTGNQSINAVEANLSFPPDKLQVVSPTTGKSLIQVWISQPTYSNSEGTLKFQGAIPTPGINTESGLISTVTFRAKSTGVATLRVQDSSKVLLNDGRGTNVLSQTTGGVYNLILPPPAGPLVTSPTHPDQEKWYQENNVVLNWDSPSDTQGFSYVLNDRPIDIPDNISEGGKNGVVYDNVSDGIHYFHIKSIKAGSWGGVTHFAVNIDKTPPATFDVDVSPDTYTSNRRPIINFSTTDESSGVDHYELKFIPLDPSEDGSPLVSGSDVPFFIEVSSPYSQELNLGRYDVVVRAYDRAGNFYQASERLTITKPVFEIIRGQGIRFGESFVISWPITWIISIIFLLGLAYLARAVWVLHRRVDRHLEMGAVAHPSIADRAKRLSDKMKEYGLRHHLFVILLVFVISFSVMALPTRARDASLPVEPPVITLFPETLSNDEIFYIGGRAGAPDAEIIIYIQNEDSGTATSHSAKTDKTGSWFLSLPQFLGAGKYLVWTQLRIADALSPPSSNLRLEVAPTAIQIGENRLSFQDFYFSLLVIVLVLLLGILIFIIYHFSHHRIKSAILRREIREAEESISRGFALLHKDIEAELSIIRKSKLSRELAAEEKIREEKLIRDLEEVKSYIGKEVWDVEQEL